MRATAAVIGAALVSVGLGCGGGEGDDRLSAAGFEIATHEVGGDAPLAGLDGRLRLDEGRGCVLVETASVIWPEGTSLLGSPVRLRLPDGDVIRPGDRITGSGGEVAIDRTRLRKMIEGNLDRLIQCADGRSVFAIYTVRRHR